MDANCRWSVCAQPKRSYGSWANTWNIEEGKTSRELFPNIMKIFQDWHNHWTCPLCPSDIVMEIEYFIHCLRQTKADSWMNKTGIARCADIRRRQWREEKDSRSDFSKAVSSKQLLKDPVDAIWYFQSPFRREARLQPRKFSAESISNTPAQSTTTAPELSAEPVLSTPAHSMTIAPELLFLFPLTSWGSSKRPVSDTPANLLIMMKNLSFLDSEDELNPLPILPYLLLFYEITDLIDHLITQGHRMTFGIYDKSVEDSWDKPAYFQFENSPRSEL